MALDAQTKAALAKLQDDALEILQEIMDIFPENRYYFTLIARHADNFEDHDVVLTSDAMEAAIEALERNKLKMESAA